MTTTAEIEKSKERWNHSNEAVRESIAADIVEIKCNARERREVGNKAAMLKDVGA
jgi:hypothetical protein